MATPYLKVSLDARRGCKDSYKKLKLKTKKFFLVFLRHLFTRYSLQDKGKLYLVKALYKEKLLMVQVVFYKKARVYY